MNYSKLCTVIVAAFMIAAVFAVPVSSDSFAAEDAAQEELLDGSYGFEIDQDDLKNSGDALMAFLESLNSGSKNVSLKLLPGVNGDIFSDKDALKAAYLVLVKLAAGHTATVSDADITAGFYAAGMVTLKEVPAGETDPVITMSVKGTVDMSMSTSVKGDSPSGEYSASVGLTASGAFSGDAVFKKIGEAWIMDDVSLRAGIEGSLSVNTDLPFLADAPAVEASADSSDDEDSDKADFSGYIAKLANTDFTVNPRLYMQADAVGVSEGELNVSVVMFNNLFECATQILSSLGLDAAEIDDLLDDMIDSYDNDVESVDNDRFDIEAIRDIDFSSVESVMNGIYTLIDESVVDASADDPIGSVKLTDEQKALLNTAVASLIGDDGFALTDSEVVSINERNASIIEDCRRGISELEHSVKILAPAGDGYKVVGDYKVKHGSSVPFGDDAVKALTVAPEGMVFVGWAMVDIETEEDDDGTVEVEYDFEGFLLTSWVFGPMNLVPVYAKQVTGFDSITGAGDFFVSSSEDFDASILEIGSKIVIDCDFDDDDDLINDFRWNFKRGPADTASSLTVQTKMVVKPVVAGDYQTDKDPAFFDRAIQLNFVHSGDLPSNTTVTIDVKDKYEAGTMFQVWHVSGDSLQLVNSSVAVDAFGNLEIPLTHCSSYVLTVGSPVEDMTPAPENGGSNNTLLYIGVGVAAVLVVVGAVLLFRRNH